MKHSNSVVRQLCEYDMVSGDCFEKCILLGNTLLNIIM